MLNVEDFSNDNNLSPTYDPGKTEIAGIKFFNKGSNFGASVRFMSPELIKKKLKTLAFHLSEFEDEFEPALTAIQRLKTMASIIDREEHFTLSVKNGNLMIRIGDIADSNSGEFCFQKGLGTGMTHAWSFPTAKVLGILSLDGEKKIKLSDRGAMVITVNSGLIDYEYILSAQTK